MSSPWHGRCCETGRNIIISHIGRITSFDSFLHCNVWGPTMAGWWDCILRVILRTRFCATCSFPTPQCHSSQIDLLTYCRLSRSFPVALSRRDQYAPPSICGITPHRLWRSFWRLQVLQAISLAKSIAPTLMRQ